MRTSAPDESLAPMPRALRGRVRRRGHALHLDLAPRARRRPIDSTIGLLVVLLVLYCATLGWAAGSSLAFVALTTLHLLALGVGIVSLDAIWDRTHADRRLIVTPQGIQAGRKLTVPKWLRLSGEVGDEIRLHGDHGLVFALQPDTRGPWQVDTLRWLARAVAVQLQVPLHDSLSKRWEDWRRHPHLRAQVEYQRRIERSRHAHSAMYTKRPLEPRQVLHEPEGPVYDEVMLERRGIRTPTLGLAWANLGAVELEIFRTPDHDPHVCLLLLTHRGLVRLLDHRLTPRRAQELLFIRDAMRENLGRRVELGSPEDIPASLQRARERTLDR